MWLVGGWIFVGLGAVGLALPVMPTVPFLLVAAYCFERGSPKLHGWLLEHRLFGPPLRDWREHRVIGWRAKILVLICLPLGMSYAFIYQDIPLWLKLIMAGVGLAVIVFILVQKSARE